MSDPPRPSTEAPDERQQLRDMNEALLVSSVRQHELTEQAQKAEERLRESEQRFRQAADATNALVYNVDLLAGESASAYGVEHIVGEASPSEGLTSAWWHQRIHPDDLPSHRQHLARCLAEQSCMHYEASYRVRHQDGTWRDVEDTARILRGADGQATRLVGTIFDVSERKAAEALVRDRDVQLRLSLQASLAIVFEWNVRNDRVRRIISNVDVLPETGDGFCSFEDVASIVHPDDRDGFRAAVQAALRCSDGRYEFEYRVIRPDGAVRWLAEIGHVDFDENHAPLRLHGISQDVTDRKEAELKSARMAAVAMAAPSAVVALDMTGLITAWNPSAERLFGYTADEAIGRHISMIAPDVRRSEQRDVLERVLAGETIRIETQRRHKTGRLVDVQIDGSPIRGAQGKVIGQSYLLQDIAERKRHEEHVRLLMGEVNHRSKNMLSLIQAIARQTAATRPEDFIERFEQRIQALAASQDLLVKSEWKAVPLHDLVRSQLAHFGNARETRVALDGQPVQITASAAQSLGMALHELATNAAKYGALSNESGRVSVSWYMTSDGESGPRFTMSWTESGGPPVETPSRRGFGSTVIDGMVKMSLGCDAQIEFAPTGLVWRVDCPVERVIEGRSTQPATRSNDVVVTDPAASGDRRRVLVVEDETLIAMEIAAVLSDAGWEIVGPASTVAQALALITKTGCDAAVLDINLGAETAEPIAHELVSSGTPFVTVSGYSREQHPLAMRKAPLIGKPMNAELLVAEMRRCLGERLE